MQIEFIGKHLEVTDQIKSFVESKLTRFKRLLKETGEDQTEVVITLSSSRAKPAEKNANKTSMFRVDIDIYLKSSGGGTVHAWEEDKDLYAAIDKVMDEVERQLLKLKERRLEYRRKSRETQEEHIIEEEEVKPLIVEEEFVMDKPMSIEDAILELTENHMVFMPFFDIESSKIKIVYRKRGNQFGVIDLNCKG